MAIFFGIGLVLVLYVAIQPGDAQGVLGNDITAHKEAPLAAGCLSWRGIRKDRDRTCCDHFGTSPCWRNLGGELLCMPRILFAGARDGLMPKILWAKVHPKFITPYIAVVWYAGCGFLSWLCSAHSNSLLLWPALPYC